MIKGEKKDNRGRSPGSQAALKATQCKKGEHPPGAGRPKGSLSLKDRMNRYLDLDIKIKMPDGSIQDKSVLDSIILSLLNKAQKGDVRAIQEVFDRNFGKETENINLMSHEDWLKELK